MQFAPRCTTPPYGSSAEGDGVFVAGVGSCEPEEDIKIQDWAVSPAPSVYRAGGRAGSAWADAPAEERNTVPHTETKIADDITSSF